VRVINESPLLVVDTSCTHLHVFMDTQVHSDNVNFLVLLDISTMTCNFLHNCGLTKGRFSLDPPLFRHVCCSTGVWNRR
jgi:hypothetical protein